jgi:hypothetical protein
MDMRWLAGRPAEAALPQISRCRKTNSGDQQQQRTAVEIIEMLPSIHVAYQGWIAFKGGAARDAPRYTTANAPVPIGRRIWMSSIISSGVFRLCRGRERKIGNWEITHKCQWRGAVRKSTPQPTPYAAKARWGKGRHMFPVSSSSYLRKISSTTWRGPRSNL